MEPESKILIGNGIFPFDNLALIYNLLSGRRRLCGLSALFVLLGLYLSTSAEIKGDMREIWVALCLTLQAIFWVVTTLSLLGIALWGLMSAKE